MAFLSAFIIFITFDSPRLFSNAASAYCSIPCPFMCSAQPPRNYGIQLPCRPQPTYRSSFYEPDQVEYEDIEEESQPPPPPTSPPPMRKRQRQQITQDQLPTPPRSKPKPKLPPEDPKPLLEDPEPPPPPKKKNISSPPPPPPPLPSCPYIQPSRRFFTSLFSIPGAIVDTLIGGEITL